jgi:signal transduction histidine kinase/phage shock protein PspC (stress-responsive transcriptional regulator)
MAEVPTVAPSRLPRSATDRVLLGVAGGIGERIGVDPLVVRLGFVLLALAGGVGFVAYLVGIVASVEPEAGEEPHVRAASGRRTVAVLLVLAGVLLVLRDVGLWMGDGVVGPAALAAFGSVVLWTRANLGRSRLAVVLSRSTTGAVRFVTGALLIAAALAAFVVVGLRSGLLNRAPAAAAAVVVVLVVVVGPWVTRLARQARDERRERIRSEERASMAAHLHDSVLQTLAMIQRTDDARRMAGLARVQERELRSWLYGRAPTAAHGSLGPAVEAIVDDVEREFGVPIEAVTVGDAPMDEATMALVAAAREALVNAARHGDASSVSLFVEADGEAVSAFVRDQGRGFDRNAVAPDRRGIADSIEGRIALVGGRAVVRSVEGEGTEVRLRVPRGGRNGP